MMREMVPSLSAGRRVLAIAQQRAAGALHGRNLRPAIE